MVREARKISRTEIVSRTRLSKTTVSDITGRLLEAGLLLPVGRSPASTRGGRKRELLQFNPDAAFVIGVDIERTHTDVALTNLDAAILHRLSFSYPAGSSPRHVLTQLSRTVRKLATHASDFTQKAFGIGVGLPGVIDRELGIITVADTLKGWEGCRIKNLLEKECGLPVYVENDVKARMLGEMIFGSGRNVRDAVYLWLGDGIGAGIVIDGRLHRGFTGTAGEIGYNSVTHSVRPGPHYPLLYTGQDDIGDLLSESNIARALGARSQRTIRPSVRLLEALRENDQHAKRLCQEISDVIGSISISVINMLNPEVVLLGGELFWGSECLLQAVQQNVRNDILPVPADAVRIAAASLKEDGVLLGSVGLVLSDLFRPTRETRDAIGTHV
jgi:predicted NBD/HSP70 family sugar kinase